MASSTVDYTTKSSPQAHVRLETRQPHGLAWNLISKRVVVVGGGAIGTAKLETLLDSGAQITVVDPKPSRRILQLAARGRVRLVRRRFLPTDLLRATLVIAASESPSTNRRICRLAKPFGAVVNTVHAVDAANTVEG